MILDFHFLYKTHTFFFFCCCHILGLIYVSQSQHADKILEHLVCQKAESERKMFTNDNFYCNSQKSTLNCDNITSVFLVWKNRLAGHRHIINYRRRHNKTTIEFLLELYSFFFLLSFNSNIYIEWNHKSETQTIRISINSRQIASERSS